MSLGATFGRICRETRLGLDISQRELAGAVGVSRGYIAHLERGAANPSLRIVDRVGVALGIAFDLIGRAPIVDRGPRQRDLVHAWCSGYVGRRLARAGWVAERETEIVHARHHGWIDCVAFHRSSGTMLVIEIKTQLDDLGATERQLAWYQRAAPDVARRLGWRPRRIAAWLLVLETDENDDVIRLNRAVFASAFPMRAAAMQAVIEGTAAPHRARGMAMIDPTSKRRSWLISARVDGRRSPPPFGGYADAARRSLRSAAPTRRGSPTSERDGLADLPISAGTRA